MIRSEAQHSCQLPVEKRDGCWWEPSDRIAFQSGPVNETGVVDQRSRIGVQAGLLSREVQMKRIFGGRSGKRNNRNQRTLGLIVRIRGNDHDGASQALFMSLNRIEPTPIDLTLLDHHFSSLKSCSEVRSQSAISLRPDGSEAACSNARCTSAQKVLSSSSRNAISITCALGWPSLAARSDKRCMAELFMRTLVATFGIVKLYHLAETARRNV